MNYWWVNQNLTYRHELHGSYLWSPKRTADDRRNVFYDNMRLVMPGDVVFSFSDTYIKAVGIVEGQAVSAPKPAEFGSAGNTWGSDGWYVPTAFQEIPNAIRPKDYILDLLPHLPGKYSPLQQNGNGNQGVYLAAIPEAMANVLVGLLGAEAMEILERAGKAGILSDSTAIDQVISDENLNATERNQVIQSRIGQGLFRSRVAELELSCRITGISDERFLIASHVKPWSKSTNFERLDGHNGLLLTPNIDRLFDRGYLTFMDDGRPLLSRLLPDSVRASWFGQVNCDPRDLSGGQRLYMAYHREVVFKGKEID